MSLAKQVASWFEQNSQPFAGENTIAWVQTHWPELAQISTRQLSGTDLILIRQRIKQIPTGKQRLYRQGLNDLLYYLSCVCHWSLPVSQQQHFIDREQIWFGALTEKAADAFQLQSHYETDRLNFIKNRHPPSDAFVALTLALRVAPLPLAFLAQILNNPRAIKREKAQTYLDVYHQNKTDPADDEYFTRYDLDLFSYTLLADYFTHAKNTNPMTAGHLLKNINRYCSQQPYYLTPFTATDLHLTLQAFWHYHYHLGPTLLKDFSQPERHVATSLRSSAQSDLMAQENIYLRDWDPRWFDKLTPSSPTQKIWPHKNLLRALKNGERPQLDSLSTLIQWHPDDLLPQMLYLYTAELIHFGGVKKAKLAAGTIETYTTIHRWFEHTPLTYANAVDPLELQNWVTNVFNAQTSEANKQVLFYFLRFMQTQAITDHLSLSALTLPLSPPGVDPLRVSLRQLHQILQILLTMPGADVLQRLNCYVAVVLAYHGMLRRGEILRLRWRDLTPLEEKGPKEQLFKVEITKTAEGFTKSRRSRIVHLVLPEEQAKLVRLLIALKKELPSETPLIGYQHESISSRNLNYLLPITRAMKSICGQQVRFHHLRHSGVHQFYLQLMHLFYDKPPTPAHYDEWDVRMLAHPVTEKRLRYWLEGRLLFQINTSLVFDEFIRQIGHENYTTTRWSYLHGLEWLTPIIRPVQNDISYPELRYLLGLQPHTALPARLKKYMPETKDPGLRKNTIAIPEHDIREVLFGDKTENVNGSRTATLSPWTEDISLFEEQIKRSKTTIASFILNAFFSQRTKLGLRFTELNTLWHRWGKHQTSSLTRSEHAALTQLWQHQIPPVNQTDNEPTELRFAISCNKKWGAIYRLLFTQTELRLFDRRFTLELNRKTAPARQREILQTDFVIHQEAVVIHKHDPGNTQLILHLSLPAELTEPWLQLINRSILSYLQK